MIGAIVTATEMQNNFERYLNIVMEGKNYLVLFISDIVYCMDGVDRIKLHGQDELSDFHS